MKAAKLSKTSVDAWNELGEYYWNKGDVSSAKTIFAAALEKVFLPSFFIVARILYGFPFTNIEKKLFICL